MTANRSGRRTEILLFLSCWIVLSVHFATNIAREHYPAMALADHASLAVDEYAGLHPDIFVAPNTHAYINNNPGVSLLAAVPLLVFRPLLQAAEAYGQRQVAASGGRVSAEYADPRPNRQRFYRQVRERGLDIKFGLVAFLTVVFCMAPLTSLAATVLFRRLRELQFTRGSALFYAALMIFGTPLFFRNGYLNHNHVLGLLVFFAFALLWRPGTAPAPPTPRRLTVAGVLGGYAVVCDYSGLVPLAFLFAYVLLRLHGARGTPAPAPASRRSIGRGAMAFACGAAVPIAGLALYQWSAFGHPLLPAQAVMPDATYSSYGYRGLSWPQGDLFAANLFDSRFGLLAFGPLLALGVPGIWLAPSGWLQRREKLLLAAFALLFLLFCSANQYARLQWNTGVRYLVPMIPFLMLGVIAVLVRVPGPVRYGVAALAIAHAWALAMVRESVPDSLHRAFVQGFELPWLTVLWKMAPQYLPGVDTPPTPWPIFLLCALAIGALWWRDRPRKPAKLCMAAERGA